jgi:hypothetical protein
VPGTEGQIRGDDGLNDVIEQEHRTVNVVGQALPSGKTVNEEFAKAW